MKKTCITREKACSVYKNRLNLSSLTNASISTEKALNFSRDAQRGSTCLTLARPGTSCLTCRVWSGRRICLASMWGCISRIHGSSRSVHVGFFLELTNVFLVSDSFIPKPVGNLSRQTKEHISLCKTQTNTNHKKQTQTSNGFFLPAWALKLVSQGVTTVGD